MLSPFLGSAYTSRSRLLNAQRAVNVYAELVETKDGKEVGAFYGTPGLVLQATVGSGPIRGLHVMSGVLYAVSGNALYRVTPTFNAVLKGHLQTSVGPVQMADNGSQLLIVDGNQAYGFQVSPEIYGQIALPYGSDSYPTTCAFQDGFFFINEAGTYDWWQSPINDIFATWDPLDFSTADGNPDPIIAMVDFQRQMWLIGTQSIEVWINGGNPGFAFQRLQNVFIEEGCVAPNSVSTTGQAILWLGQNSQGCCVVYQSNGYQAVRVSTHAIEREIQSYAVITDAIGYMYQQEGHTFYVLTFPNADKTWCYDTSTGLWHERASWKDEHFHRHRSNCYAAFANKSIVGDFENGNLYAFDLDEYTDDGAVLKRLRSWPANPTGQITLNRNRYDMLQLYADVGNGTQTGQGYDPRVMLRFSNDGGKSFIPNEYWAPLGKIGEESTRCMWRRLGSGRDRVFEVSLTDPVKCAWLAAFVDVQPGLS